MLNELIDEAVKNNHDLKIAISKIEQAKALRRESIGGFFPSITGNQDSKKEKFSDKVSNVSAGERDVFSADLDASWELDLFGKKRRNFEAAKARLQASEENKNAILLAVIAEVARNYFEVRGLQKRIDILDDNLAILGKVEDLAQKQFKGGMVTEFDISRARGERQEVEAKLPDLKSDMQAGIYRISVLSGQPPEHYLEKLSKKMTLASPPDVVPVGLRSDILRRRPDIRAAEREVAAATADIGVQTAELFPSISLTGTIGTSAGLFGDLFGPGAGTFTVGSLVKWSLFEGGAIRARIDAAKATSKTSLYQYEKAVLVALEDVENSLLR